jgi:16S rRNA (uracil1498-N3)-methyltransferase
MDTVEGNTETSLAIGPEGGWTYSELTLFEQNSWLPSTLGPTILRAETAAIAALAIVQASLWAKHDADR